VQVQSNRRTAKAQAILLVLALLMVSSGLAARAQEGELLDFDPYGDCGQWACPPCDDPGGWCPPCLPTCFLPPC